MEADVVVSAVSVQGFRGIEEGRVEGLAPLTILTGPNGCGKSTLLEALLIAASGGWDDGLRRVVTRHTGVVRAARWLWFRGPGNVPTAATIACEAPGTSWSTSLSFEEDDGATTIRLHGNAPGDGIVIQFGDTGSHTYPAGQERQRRNRALGEQLGLGPRAVLIDPAEPLDLAATYSSAELNGFGDQLESLLNPLGFSRLKILREPLSQQHGLYLTPHGGLPLPVALAGDGILAMLRIALQLASVPQARPNEREGGLALIEEPERAQHPKSLEPTVQALVAAVERGIQIVLTTHSDDLIAALFRALGEARMDQVAQFTLALRQGKLLSHRLAGADLWVTYRELGEDLR